VLDSAKRSTLLCACWLKLNSFGTAEQREDWAGVLLLLPCGHRLELHNPTFPHFSAQAVPTPESAV